MSERLLVWAACPTCETTWSEQVPDIGDRTDSLIRMVTEDLVYEARRCRETHPSSIEVGIDGLASVAVAS